MKRAVCRPGFALPGKASASFEPLYVTKKMCRVKLEKYSTKIQALLHSSSSSRFTFNFIGDRRVSLLENRLWTRGGRFTESKLLTAKGDSVDLAVDIIRRSWCSVAICLRRKSSERERETGEFRVYLPKFRERLRSSAITQSITIRALFPLLIISSSHPCRFLSSPPHVSSFSSLSSFLFSFARFPFAEAERLANASTREM